MAKRFSDTEIWDKEWFMTLRPAIKCLVKIVRDKADLCGLWSPNFTIVSMYLGEKVTESDLLSIDNGQQFRKLPNGKIYCIGFVEFQYGELSEKSPVHRKVIKILEQNNFLEDYKKSSSNRVLNSLFEKSNRVKEEEEDKEEDKEEETVEVEKAKNDFLDLVFLDFKNIKIKPDEFEKLCQTYTQEVTEKAIKYLSDYKIEKGYKTKSDYLTLKRWVFEAITKQKNGNTENKPRKPKSYGGIEASSLAEFLGVSPDGMP